MSWWGDAWDKVSGFGQGFGEKTVGSLENIGQMLAAPVGVAFDAVRWVTPLDSDDMSWLSTKGSLGALGDTLGGEGTLTGWTMNRLYDVSNAVILDPIETVGYLGQGASWSEAYNLARERSTGEAMALGLDSLMKGTGDLLNVNLAPWVTTSPIGQNLSDEGFIGDSSKPEINSLDKNAWQQLQEQSPFWSGVTASALDTAVLFAADPIVLGAKATQIPRELRSLRPIREGEEVNLAERMASEESIKIGPFRSSVGGLQSRTDPLIGTVKYEDLLDDAGKVVRDDDGVVAQIAVQDKTGWLDNKSAGEIYAGLNLRDHAYGADIAALLERTNKISDPAARVNTRRDILATMGGDTAATQRLVTSYEEGGQEMADALSNMFRGRGSGENEFMLANEVRVAETGKHAPVETDPHVVAGIEAELKAQEGFNTWLYASMKDRTFRITPKADRAVARYNQQGLGRDGTLHTGWTNVDQFVNDKVLGRLKSSGSVVDEALAKSADDVIGEPKGLAAGKTYEADTLPWWRGSSQQAATIARRGIIKVADWSNPLATGAKISDALRGRVVQGALNVEDEALSVAVTQEFLRRSGMEAADIDRHVSNVVRAENPVGRATAVLRAQDDAVKALAERYGVDQDTIAKIGTIHKERQEATMAALRGQVYSAHEKVGPGGKIRGDYAYLPGDGGTVVAPILDTQTINNLPLLDLAYVEKWLSRDKALSAFGELFSNFRRGGNTQATQATAMGFNSRVNAKMEAASDRILRHYADSANGWWKRGVLLTRAPSYAIRNTTEEIMRVWASGWTGHVADQAMVQARHDVRDLIRRHRDIDKVSPALQQQLAPQYAIRNARKLELEDLLARRNNPELEAITAATRKDLRSAQSKLAWARRKGDEQRVAELEAVIQDIKARPALATPEQLDAQIVELERTLQHLEAELKQRTLPSSGKREVFGVEMPDAFEGVRGRQAYDAIANSGAYDHELAHIAEREYVRRKGVNAQDIISVQHASAVDDKVLQQRHGHAWSWVVNRQIRQDEAARVALGAMSRGESNVTEQVYDWLASAKGAAYRRGNPHRNHDLEEWSQDISDMVKHHVPTDEMAKRVLERDIDVDELLTDFPTVTTRPDVHTAGVDTVFGYKAKEWAERTGAAFKFIDRMSVNRITRHPLFAATYRQEQDRLAADFLRRAQAERGADATFTVDEVNHIADRARKTAQKRVKDSFYDTSSRSTAAEQLRFIFPFFAAHQDSMQFWGKALIQNPKALRELQLGFSVPYSLGLVTDRDGNVIDGAFPSSDHVFWLQVPKGWGGPDLSDPTSKRGKWTLNPTSFNLILQNGGILNPGAGPMAAIPVGALQKHLAGSDPELSKIMDFVSPYGAPKEADNPVLPEALQFLDPALPTPVKRLAGILGSRESAELYNKLSQDAYVDFVQRMDRPPSQQEIKELEQDVKSKVQHVSGLRAYYSLFSPVQPSPASPLEGFRQEFRRLADQAENEGRGRMWAENEFLERYGEEYMILTRSSSMNRARLKGTPGEVSALRANEGLANITDPGTWRAIIGAEGQGEFNFDARRWMESKTVNSNGDKLIDRKDAVEQLLDTSVQMGWRDYNKVDAQLQAIATQNGLNSYTDSPTLVQLRRLAQAELAQRYPDWAASRTNSSNFESELLPSLEKIATNKKLLSDPARTDVQVLREYLQGRQAFINALSERQRAGGSVTLSAQDNRDLVYAFGVFAAQLYEKNTNFAEYMVEGILTRDPWYKAGQEALEAVHG